MSNPGAAYEQEIDTEGTSVRNSFQSARVHHPTTSQIALGGFEEQTVDSVVAPNPSPPVDEPPELTDQEKRTAGVPLPMVPLCGRAKEKATLSRAYERLVDSSLGKTDTPRTSFLLVKGAEGVGKTYLVEKTLKDRAEADSAYFIPYVFDQYRRSHLTRIFDEAFESFVSQCCARGKDEIALVRRLIHESDELDEASFSEVVPCMMKIILPNPQKSHSSLLHQSARRSGLLRGLILALSAERPVILCVENLQWALPSTNDTLLGLVSSLLECRFLLVATFRHNCDAFFDFKDTSSTPGVTDKLCEKWKDHGVQSERILLDGLSETNHAELVRSMVPPDPMEGEATGGLAAYQGASDFVFNVTKGNPLFTCELLRSLLEENLVVGDNNRYLVKLDDVETRIRYDSLHALLRARALTASPETRRMLTWAAPCGVDINQVILSNAYGEEDHDLTAKYLEEAVRKQIVEESDGISNYKFLHSSMQHAFYCLIEEEERASFHLALGRKLWRSMSVEQIRTHLPTVALQFFLGSHLMTDQSERYALASIVHSLGTTAAKNSSFVGGMYLLQRAKELLGEDCWRVERDLTLAICNNLAEVRYTIGDFEGVDNLVTEILSNGRSPVERLQAHCLRINTRFANNQIRPALDLGLRILSEEFDTTLPRDATRRHVMLAQVSLSRKLKGKSDEWFLRLPAITNPTYLGCMKVLSLLVSSTYLANPLFVPLITFRMMEITVEHGTCSFTSVALAMYGVMLCGRWRVEDGYRYGRLALRMLEKYRLKEFLPRVYTCVYGEIQGYVRPRQHALSLLRRAVTVAMETGDVEFAMISSNKYCICAFFTGDRYLPDLMQEVQRIRQDLSLLNQKSLMRLHIPSLFTVQSLVCEPPFEETMPEDTLDDESDLPNQTFPKIWLAGQKCMVAYYLGDYEKSVEHASNFFELRNPPFKPIDFVTNAAFGALALITAYPQSRRSKRSTILKRVREAMNMLELAAKHAPQSCLSKLYLLRAEVAALKKNPLGAYGHYTTAIALAAKHGILGEEGIACERAGRFMLNGGGKQPRAALTYYEEALDAYRRWGATAKVLHFETEVELLRQKQQASSE